MNQVSQTPSSTDGLDASHHRWMSPLGIVLMLLGGAGTLLLSTVVMGRISSVLEGSQIYSFQVLYEGLWLLFFASLFVLGGSLLVSALRKVTHNAVPGPTLYVMGASLMVIGLMMLMYDQVFQAALAMGIGLVLMIAEWYYDEI